MDTAPKPVEDPAQRARRPAHELNDVRVTLREGAVATPVYRNGPSVNGGSGRVGIVWVVGPDGSAIVHFGFTTSGHELKCVTHIGQLERSLIGESSQ